MIATGGFGAFPDNPLTQNFQEVISENIPAEYLEPFNAYMESISAPTIEPQFASGSDSPFDPIGTIMGADNPTAESVSTLSIAQINTSIAEFSASMTAVSAGTTTAIATLHTATLHPTSTFPPTWTSLPSLTASPTAVPTLTLAPIVVYPTSTKTRRPPDPATDTPMPNLTTTPLTSTATTNLTTTPPTSTPVTYLVLYDSGSTSTGDLVDRASADAFCALNLPSGFSNYHAFIGFSAADNISNLPSNYGISTSVPIRSTSNVVIANNWADLLDGSILTTLASAGVISNYWWSGVETDGTSVDGVTADCTDWTDSTNVVAGYYGDYQFADGRWIKGAAGGACDQMLAILCIGY